MWDHRYRTLLSRGRERGWDEGAMLRNIRPEPAYGWSVLVTGMMGLCARGGEGLVALRSLVERTIQTAVQVVDVEGLGQHIDAMCV